MLTPTTVLARDGTLSQGVYGTGRDRVLIHLLCRGRSGFDIWIWRDVNAYNSVGTGWDSFPRGLWDGTGQGFTFICCGGWGKGLALILEAGEMLTPTLVLAWDGTVPQDGGGSGFDIWSCWRDVNAYNSVGMGWNSVPRYGMEPFKEKVS